MASGDLACTADCKLDLTACAFCGDNKIGNAEACDGADLGGAACEALVGAGSVGVVSCTPGCAFDLGGCSAAASCGDGKVDAGEACDGADLGGATCDSATGHPDATGVLVCGADCQLVTAGCNYCGDLVAGGAEACDSVDLKGATCVSALSDPNASGALACSAACGLDTSGCISCADGVKNGVETDKDCGGSGTCLRCALGKSCLVGGDCLSGLCLDVCVSPAFVLSSTSPVNLGTALYGLGVTDVNGDGKGDVVINESFNGLLRLMLGDAAGNLAKSPNGPFATSFSAQSLVLGDFNGDSVKDVVVAGGALTVLAGGKGTFTAASSLPKINGFNISSGDFNKDGKLDVVVTTQNNPREIVIFLGDGAGGMVKKQALPFDNTIVWTTVGDVNEDGAPDILVGRAAGTDSPVLLGKGDGTFSPGAAVPLLSSSLVLADMNGDGHLDLAASTKDFTGLVVRLGDGKGTFGPSPKPVPPVGKATRQVVVADFDKNGKPDLAACVSLSADVEVFLNFDAGFVKAPGGPFATSLDPADELAAGDIDGDGKPDLVAVRQNGTISVLLNKLPLPDPAQAYRRGPRRLDSPGDGREPTTAPSDRRRSP